MIKTDLITGFLGSGKTTFIRGYASYLLRQNQRIAILENDYGAINVDMMMLKDLQC
ncbi:MAG: GTPase (G3E family), partial [Lachnospiraceae bacterium]|nr:GTPase (G3E family) [Lachnospiraceae bacterium]